MGFSRTTGCGAAAAAARAFSAAMRSAAAAFSAAAFSAAALAARAALAAVAHAAEESEPAGRVISGGYVRCCGVGFVVGPDAQLLKLFQRQLLIFALQSLHVVHQPQLWQIALLCPLPFVHH